MIKYLTKEAEEIKELPSTQNARWMCILPDFTGADLIEWSHQFGIPGNYLIDALDVEKRPQYEAREGMTYLIIRTPILVQVEDAEDELYRTAPIGIIIKGNCIITICAYESPVLQYFIRNEVPNFDPSDIPLFVLQLFEQNVLYYLECLKQLDTRRNVLEEILFDSSHTTELKRLLGIDKSLIFFVNSLSANDMLKKKIWKSDILQIRQDKGKSALFEEIRMDNAQALETANMYTNILNGIMDTYGTIISTNLNVTIGRLTVITVVLMVPTLIASFYGMNVSLPFEKNPYAFYGIITIAVSLIFILVWYFRNRRFL